MTCQKHWDWFDTSKFLINWKPHNCKKPGDYCTNSTHTSLFGCHVKSTCDQKVPIFFLWHLLFYFKLPDYQSVLIKHAYCFLLIFFKMVISRVKILRPAEAYCYDRGSFFFTRILFPTVPKFWDIQEGLSFSPELVRDRTKILGHTGGSFFFTRMGSRPC